MTGKHTSGVLSNLVYGTMLPIEESVNRKFCLPNVLCSFPLPSHKINSKLLNVTSHDVKRLRYKTELERLRLETQRLQSQLDQIKVQHSSKVKNLSFRRSKAWRRLALCVKKSRERSENENANLRALLKQQICIIQQLESIIDPASYTQTPIPRTPTGFLDTENSHVPFNILFELSQQDPYKSDLLNLNSDMETIRVIPHDDFRVRIERVRCEMLPFPKRLVADARWAAFSACQLPLSSATIEAIANFEETRIADLSSPVDIDGVRSQIYSRGIFKRIEKDNVTSIIWQSHGTITMCNSELNPNHKDSAVRLRGRGWVVYEVGKDNSVTWHKNCTQVDIMPDPIKSRYCQQNVTKSIITSVGEVFGELDQVVENLTLENLMISERTLGSLSNVYSV